jgi:hypothetical protein
MDEQQMNELYSEFYNDLLPIEEVLTVKEGLNG